MLVTIFQCFVYLLHKLGLLEQVMKVMDFSRRKYKRDLFCIRRHEYALAYPLIAPASFPLLGFNEIHKSLIFYRQKD